MSEIIVIHVGRCGCQVGVKFWELLCAEHKLEDMGRYTGDSEQALEGINVFFKEDVGHRYQPRAIFVDPDPDIIGLVRQTQLGSGVNPDNLIVGQSGLANNWAKGYYTDGAELLDHVVDAIRNEEQSCQDLQGFIVIHALGGGSGSGLGSLILSSLREEYPDKIIATFSVFPAPQVSDVVTEPYNAVLSIPKLMEQADLVFCLDNAALYNICVNSLKNPKPTLNDLNRIIATTLSNITAPLRFPAQATNSIVTLRALAKHLVPANSPALHFLTIGAAPITSQPSRPATSRTAQDLTMATAMISNHTVTQAMFKRIGDEFSALFKNKRFLHRYTGEGMDEQEFIEAESALQNLIAAYAKR